MAGIPSSVDLVIGCGLEEQGGESLLGIVTDDGAEHVSNGESCVETVHHRSRVKEVCVARTGEEPKGMQEGKEDAGVEVDRK
jgi:hypothetical protein